MTSKSKNLAAHTLANKDGSVGPVFGLMIMPMVMMMGMGVDYGRAVGVQNRVQSALDAGALAAMISGKTASADVQAAGERIFKINLGDNQFNTMHDVALFERQTDGTVSAVASVSMPTTFATIFGIDTLQVDTYTMVEPSKEIETDTGTSTTSTSNTPCIHVMSQSDSGAFYLKNNEDLDAKKCIVHVRSNKSDAFIEEGGEDIDFKRIRIKGYGEYTEGILNAASVVKENQAITGNPYDTSVNAVVAAITVGNCTNDNTNKIWTGSVSPGTYCGSTEFKDVVFGKGLYIIKSGSGNNKNGALKFSGDVNGSAGVSFYLADNKSSLASYSGKDGTVLKAPSDGITRGLLFFENSNRGSRWDVTFQTCKIHTWEGLVYLPSANVTIKNMEEWTKFEVSMAAHTLQIDSWEELEWKPYSWTPFNATSPITLGSEDDDVTTTTSTSTTKTDIYLKE